MKTKEELEEMRTKLRNELGGLQNVILQARNVLSQAEPAAIRVSAQLTLIDELEPPPQPITSAPLKTPPRKETKKE